MKYTLIILISGILLSSCNKETETDPVVTPTPVPTITISLASDVLPLFNTSCNGTYCHGGGSDGKYFDNHANITDVPTATLLGAINHSAGFEAMPKSQAKLSQGKIDTITTWINEGSLDN
jgi:hypothetical protein